MKEMEEMEQGSFQCHRVAYVLVNIIENQDSKRSSGFGLYYTVY